MATCEKACLCEYAYRDQEGNLRVVEEYKHVYVPKVSFRRDFSFVWLFVADPGEEDIDVKIRILWPNGGGISRSAVLNQYLEAGRKEAFVRLDKVLLLTDGDHVAQLLFDGRVVFEVPFQVVVRDDRLVH